MVDAALGELQDAIRAAAAARRPLAICGGGTKSFYGEPSLGETLRTSPLAGIVAYAPTELVITARAGTPLAEVEETMRGERQMLGFEPPHFGPGATLGGAIAAGLSGPRRPYAGAARDFVLGLRVVDGTGEELGFGGRVMKNVAGFDVARLMTGALGTLGVITELSLKCLPLPKAESTRVFECGAQKSLRMVNAWGGQPLPLSATAHHEGRLHVRLSGAAPAVTAAERVIGGAPVDGAKLWADIRDHAHAFFAGAVRDGKSLWRISVKSTAPADGLPGGEQLIEWGGSLRWVAASAGADVERIRSFAAANGGHATLFRAGDKTAGVFQKPDATMLGLHKRLKATFDPHGILNPGRLYAGL